jgi:hypothetical protein
MRQPLVLGLVLASLVLGCSAGPGKKPSTLTWKVFNDKTQLRFPPTTWTKGPWRYQLTEARYERSRTVFKDVRYSLRFEFKVTNVSAQAQDLNQAPSPSASLTLQDGSAAPTMIWIYNSPHPSAPSLAPGEVANGLLFNDNSVPEGARPKLLQIDGQTLRW